MVIATSREPLGVSGEALFPIGGLDADAAVALFADRGSAVRASFTIDADNRPVVAELCRRLDHLPLALELAAARLRVLPLNQLVGLLDDRFRVLTGGSRTALARHQTLRAVVDWSHDLLFDDERRLFARLAVFTGGCGLEAVESVCADDALDRVDILDLLEPARRQVVGRRRVRRVGRRALLAAADIVGVRTRTPRRFRRGRRRARSPRAVVPGPESRTPVRVSAVSTDWCGGRGIAAELANLRGALDWYIERGDATSALSLTTATGLGLAPTQRLSAGCPLARGRARSAGRRSGHVAGRGHRAGTASAMPGSRDQRSALAEVLPAIEVLRDGSDPQRLGDALLILGELLNRNGDIATTRVVLAEAHPILTALGDPLGAGGPRPARRRVSGADG